MPIVLAIEPDRRQAAHLTAIARHLVDTELLLADTTEGALDAIGSRVPDLVLVPALLSPQDDAALAAALRVIATAAHVRTLTIPVLANGTKRETSGGMLAKWRRSRAASPEPDGCDPAVFREQISTYLKEAAAERAELEGDPVEHDAIAAIRPIPAVPEPIPVDFELGDPTPIPSRDAEVESFAAVDQPWTESMEPWAAEPVDAPAHETVEEPLIDLSDALTDLSGDEDDDDEDDGELFDGERVGVYTISTEADDPAIDAFDLLTAILEPPAIAELRAAPIAMTAAPMETAPLVDTAPEARADAPSPVEPVFTAPIVAEPPLVEPVGTESVIIDALTAEPVRVEAFVAPRVLVEPLVAEELFVEPPEPPRADIEPWVPTYLTPGRMWPALEGMPAETPAGRSEQPDWIELVASLRQDLERRRTVAASPAADPIAARPSDGVHADAHRLVSKEKTPKKAKPIQDEWGFFDPEQCGFSTLLAKLEEITEGA